MKRLFILGAVWALAVARPEQYKEKEDFQFSRSSSDDGTKSGFYGAQRGNMGGNYERAHNMDSLAQNQMSGLVRQVEGELGDGANTRAGSVYTAANSRGTFGSGHYDLGNLAGRNFQESTAYDNSHARSSLSSSSAYNAAGYANSRSQSSQHSGYQAAGHSGLNLQSDNLQSLDNTQGIGQYEYGRQSSNSAGYNAHSGFQQHSVYDASNANSDSGYGSNVRTRLISATPVRIIVRPGTRVAIPVSAQSYDITHGSSVIDQNSLNSDAEVLSNDNQRTVYRPNNGKHYESSYNYRKEWEKHDTIPSTVILPTLPTANPFPQNSELFDTSQARTASVANQYDATRVASQRAHSSNIYGGYNANVKSASSQSRSNYDTQHLGAATHSNSNAYTLAGYNAESSLQGASSDSSLNAYNQANQYNAGSRYHGAAADSSSLTQAGYNTGLNGDLNSQVENLNAKPKSYQSSYSYHKSWERQGDPYVIKPASSGYYDGQSSQRLTTGSAKNHQDYTASGLHYQHSHQSGADCDENGQIRVARSPNMDQYQDMQQQSQNLEDFGQQAQDLGQQSQNLEDFGQQTQDLGQQSQNLEDFGQQAQDLGQQSQNLENFGQQAEDLVQQTQGQWAQQEAGQQAQSTWDNLEDLSQQSHNKWDEIHKTWDKFENLGQNTENNWNQKDLGQKTQDTNNEFENLEQKTQNDLGQHIQQGSEIEQGNNAQDADQQTQDKWDFSNTRQHDQENVYKQNHDHHYDQSNQFNQQETQIKVDEPNIFKYLQPSQTQNDNKPKKEQLSGNTQQTYKTPETNEQNKTEYFGLDSGFFHSQDYNNQNQLSKNKTSFQETSKLYESNNWYIDSSIHREGQTTNTDSYSHTLEKNSPNPAPLSNLWNKLDTIEQQSSLLTGIGNENIGEGNDFLQVHTNSQNSYHVNQENISQNKSNEIQTAKESPHDIGRGDIGPEDVSDAVEDKKPNKYPFQTIVSEEATENNNKNNNTEIEKDFRSNQFTDLSVLSFNQQKQQDQISQNENKNKTNIQHNYQDFQQQEHRHLTNLPTLGKENSNDFGQNENLQQQHSHNIGQQDYLEEHNLQNFGQNNLNQQNLQDFGQKNLQDFEHQEDQQNIRDFGQHVNMEQQNLQDFGQHENLEQHNIQDFGQHVTFEQQNLQDFGQHENLEQHNTQDFGQHVNLEQQNLQDFGKHENLEQHNTQDFGQHVNLEQQNLQDFGRHENNEQQKTQDLSENLQQQNTQDLGQHENVEQQNLQDFTQHEYLELQRTLGLGQQENLEQQNSQDFGQHENLEQQNLQVFGQHEKFDQQNLQDFGQQNIQNFEQHDFLEQQRFQNLGHHSSKLENLERSDTSDQKNTQNFGLSENLDHVQSQIYLPHPEEVEEPIQVKKQNNDLQSIPPQSQNTVVVPPIEPVTEKPGFWKSVGNKLSTAKSKIASWF